MPPLADRSRAEHRDRLAECDQREFCTVVAGWKMSKSIV
jgi:hypothetical protein